MFLQYLYVAGGDHIDTRAVRTYLNKLEVSLKMGRYEFGPAKPSENRTSDRPYSKMSWRDKDIDNMERRAKKRATATSSHSGSSIGSRPNSSKYDPFNQLGRQSSLSFLSASEKLMMESERPRLLNREAVDRRLKSSSALSLRSQISNEDLSTEDKTHLMLEINLNDPETDEVETRLTQDKIDSFGDDIGPMDDKTLAKTTKIVRTSDNSELVPNKLFNRYSSAGSSRVLSRNSQTASRHTGRINSGKSVASTYLSVGGATSRASAKSARSVKSPFDINKGNTMTVTTGPNANILSLLGSPKTPRDINREIHHKSAWYHVPGRYETNETVCPPKRSQKTHQSQNYEHFIRTSTPGFGSKRKFSPTKSVGKAPDINIQLDDNFGPTVKSLEPVMNGYDLDSRTDPMFITDENTDQETYVQPTISVKFKDAVIVD